MLDGFQNLFFGKKKSSGETEKNVEIEKPYPDDFVMIGSVNEANPSSNTSDLYPFKNFSPKNAHNQKFFNEDLQGQSALNHENPVPIMPLSGIPFTINSALYASTKLEQIWQSVTQCLSQMTTPSMLDTDEYDFSLEKSVIAETSNK